MAHFYGYISRASSGFDLGAHALLIQHLTT